MKYVTVPLSEVTQDMIGVCAQTSFDTLRKSADETQAVLKYPGTKPSELKNYTVCTHTQIREIMLTDKWTKEDTE